MHVQTPEFVSWGGSDTHICALGKFFFRYLRHPRRNTIRRASSTSSVYTVSSERDANHEIQNIKGNVPFSLKIPKIRQGSLFNFFQYLSTAIRCEGLEPQLSTQDKQQPLETEKAKVGSPGRCLENVMCTTNEVIYVLPQHDRIPKWTYCAIEIHPSCRPWITVIAGFSSIEGEPAKLARSAGTSAATFLYLSRTVHTALDSNNGVQPGMLKFQGLPLQDRHTQALIIGTE
ncbi:hypothetical protein F4776DRAFT_69897 [Hypoxylon sp. NC0597]|nr:hypothetical protein F4776DRAFT_69897 [Hypoxylon sp. NC0597]